MAYRVAIVDDSNIDAEYVQSILSTWAQDRQAGVQAQGFVSAENFLFHYADDKTWDILLLDIEMGAMDGVSLAKKIRQENELVQIVFITGYSDYIAEGYEAFMKLFDENEIAEMRGWLERELDYDYSWATGNEANEGIIFDYVREWLIQNIRDNIISGSRQLFDIVYNVL